MHARSSWKGWLQHNAVRERYNKNCVCPQKKCCFYFAIACSLTHSMLRPYAQHGCAYACNCNRTVSDYDPTLVFLLSNPSCLPNLLSSCRSVSWSWKPHLLRHGRQFAARIQTFHLPILQLSMHLNNHNHTKPNQMKLTSRSFDLL